MHNNASNSVFLNVAVAKLLIYSMKVGFRVSNEAIFIFYYIYL